MDPHALLIDGDNVSAACYDEILRRALALGDVPIRRAYADTSHLPNWSKVSGLRVLHSGMDKNTTDLLMTIEAMELALRDKIARFVIASSDGDLAHLALRLREYGVEVVGIGEPNASAKFSKACTKFLNLPNLKPDCVPPSKEAATELSPLDQEIAAVLAQHGGQMLVSRLGSLMGDTNLRGDKTYKAKDIPLGNWSKYLAAHPELYRLSQSEAGAIVRLAPAQAPRLAAVS